MIRLNESFLHHRGSTDVITFDYTEAVRGRTRWHLAVAEKKLHAKQQDDRPALLHGEIFLCANEAVVQARRFRATWQSELVRYVVHGVLHLLGYDDRNRGARRKMKAAEERLVRQLAGEFDFRRLG